MCHKTVPKAAKREGKKKKAKQPYDTAFFPRSPPQPDI